MAWKLIKEDLYWAGKCKDCEGSGKDGRDRFDPPNWYVCEKCNGSGEIEEKVEIEKPIEVGSQADILNEAQELQEEYNFQLSLRDQLVEALKILESDQHQSYKHDKAQTILDSHSYNKQLIEKV